MVWRWGGATSNKFQLILDLMSLAGTPPTTEKGTTDLVTTDPAAITEPFPIRTPLVITQLDTNLVSAIIGMYFGGSLVKK